MGSGGGEGNNQHTNDEPAERDTGGDSTSKTNDQGIRSVYLEVRNNSIQDYNEWLPGEEIDWINIFIDAGAPADGATTVNTFGGIYGFNAAQQSKMQFQSSGTGYYGRYMAGVLEVSSVEVTSQDDPLSPAHGEGWIWKLGYYYVSLNTPDGNYTLWDYAPEILTMYDFVDGNVGLFRQTTGYDISTDSSENPTRDSDSEIDVKGSNTFNRYVWFDQIAWSGNVESGILIQGDFSHTMVYTKSSAGGGPPRREPDRIKEKFSYTNTKWSKSIEDMFKDPLGQVTSTSQMVRNSFIKTKVPNRLSLRNFSSLSSETKSQPTTSATGVY